MRGLRSRRAGTWLGLLLLLFLSTRLLGAQGCSQCQDNLRATPARTQVAYRRAIFLMMFAGSAVFVGGVYAVRRFR